MAIQDQINRITGEVRTQNEIISDIKTVLSDLDDGLTAMGEEVKVLADTQEGLNLDTMTEKVADANEKVETQTEIITQIKTALQGKAMGNGKEEQEKTLTVTENGSYKVLPEENKVLSGVNVEVDVKGDEFIGIKYSDFSGGYNTPKIADMRSLSAVDFSYAFNHPNTNLFASLFQNNNGNANGGFFVTLEEVYLLDGMTFISGSMFRHCNNLRTLHGDLSEVKVIDGNAFYQCQKLPKLPFMPKLQRINAQAFFNCIGLTEITLPNTITSVATNSFQYCTGLTNVTLLEGWSVTINLSWSNNLTQESLHKMIENLADLTGQTYQTFQVGSTNIAKIDEEHIAMLENKNWEYM